MFVRHLCKDYNEKWEISFHDKNKKLSDLKPNNTFLFLVSDVKILLDEEICTSENLQTRETSKRAVGQNGQIINSFQLSYKKCLKNNLKGEIDFFYHTFLYLTYKNYSSLYFSV